jgi:pimeloyl-ACP methyl ester carboxylesterase
MNQLSHTCWLLFELALLYLAVVALGVSGGVLAARFLARHEPMDEAQARIFGHFRPSTGLRAYGLLLEVLIAAFDLVLRLLWLLRVLRRPSDPGSGTPIVMLPGYTENAGALYWFACKLKRRGFRPFLVDFPSTFSRIDSNVEFLRQTVLEIRQATGSERVAIVAHSMGGVVARAFLLSDPDHSVITLIALASPFRGTHMARLGALMRLGESVIDMSPSSPFAHRFVPSARATVPIRVIIGEQENVVSPPWACVLPECEVHLLSVPVGHDAPLHLVESYDRLESWLLQDGVLRSDDAAELPPKITRQLERADCAALKRADQHPAHDLKHDQHDYR